MSSSKNVVVSHRAINSQSMGAGIASAPVSSAYQDNIGIQVKWTSDNAVGVIAIEASINYDKVSGQGDWVALSFSPALVQPNSDNGSYLVNLNQLPFPWYRVTYTRTSGTGTLDVWFSSKEI